RRQCTEASSSTVQRDARGRDAMGFANRSTAAMLAVVAVGISPSAVAQTFPTQDVHFVVGFAAGSGPDTIARFVAEKIRAKLNNRATLVENKVGAIGNTATEYVARAKPDGHTLYITGGNALAASGHLFKTPPVDVSKAVELVATLSIQPVMLV